MAHRTRWFALSVCTMVILLANAAGASGPPICDRSFSFNAKNFSRPTTINNMYLPLTPGTQRVYEGTITDPVTGTMSQHEVVFTATDLVKVINGVRTIVMWDEDYLDGELTESELAFFAQDDDGNVWNLGEFPALYESDVFQGAPATWIHGIDQAIGGVHMQAKPRPSTRSYLQGYSPTVEFGDCGQVVESGAFLNNSYPSVLVTHEWAADDPNAIQVKKYAPKIGVVEISAINDVENEVLTLTEFNQMRARQLKAARDAALALEKLAYENSAVYRKTSPMFRPR